MDALPEEKQQEVRDFAEFIARKDRRQRRSSNRNSAVTLRRPDESQTVHMDHIQEDSAGETVFDTTARPIWETIMEIGQSIPVEEWSNIPTDLALNLEHYLYGEPRKGE